MHLWALLLLWLLLKVDVFLWLSVRNGDNHSGGFHTYEKHTHTISHIHTETHAHQSVWRSCLLPPVASFVSASGCSQRRPCFCPCQQTSARSFYSSHSPSSSSHFHFLLLRFFISLLSIFPLVVVYFPLSPLTSSSLPSVHLLAVPIR